MPYSYFNTVCMMHVPPGTRRAWTLDGPRLDEWSIGQTPYLGTSTTTSSMAHDLR